MKQVFEKMWTFLEISSREGGDGRDHMVDGFRTTHAISAYHHYCFEFEPRGVLDTTLCDKVCQWLATDRWFAPASAVSSTNKTDSNDITEILLKVALSTVILTLYFLAPTGGSCRRPRLHRGVSTDEKKSGVIRMSSSSALTTEQRFKKRKRWAPSVGE